MLNEKEKSMSYPVKKMLPVENNSDTAKKILWDHVQETYSIDMLDEENYQRLESAIDNNFIVYPKSTGIYTIESEENKYEVNITRDDQELCTCLDSIYRSDSIRCKHTWIVMLLASLKAIPSKNQNPYRWIYIAFESDIKYLQENNLSEQKQKTQLVLNFLKKKQPHDVNYKKLFKKRYKIMQSVLH